MIKIRHYNTLLFVDDEVSIKHFGKRDPFVIETRDQHSRFVAKQKSTGNIINLADIPIGCITLLKRK